MGSENREEALRQEEAVRGSCWREEAVGAPRPLSGIVPALEEEGGMPGHALYSEPILFWVSADRGVG